MDSSFNIMGKFVDLVAIILLLFLIPIYYTSSLNDSSINTYILREVDMFGDQVCKNGYISVSMYEDLLEKLSNTDLLYDIEMIHAHDVFYPDSTGFEAEEQTVYVKDIKGQLYANTFQSLTYYSKGDYVYGSDGMLYQYLGTDGIYPYNPALITDFDPITGASPTYSYWNLVGEGIQGKYLLHDGDRFSITVSSRSDTTSQKISTLFGFGTSSGIHAYGGGMVVDENY